jgi:putative transcriptional regulator
MPAYRKHARTTPHGMPEGPRVTARAVTVQPAPRLGASDVIGIRTRLSMSQHVFASALNVSPETVRGWEQGKRTPDGASLRLLAVADAHPEWIMSQVTQRVAQHTKLRRR